MGWFFIWVSVAFGVCPASSVEAMESSGAVLLDAYDQLDAERFDRAAEALESQVRCLDEVLDPERVGRLHQWMGWISFSRGDRTAARASWAAAREIDPTWQPSRVRVPIGHPLSEVYAEAGVVAWQGVDLAPNRWWVNGVRRGDASRDHALLLQRTGLDGQVVHSAYYEGIGEVPPSVNQTSGFRAAQLELSVSGILGGRTSLQTPQDEGGALGEVDASRWVGGVRGSARWALHPRWGLELVANSLGATDPVKGGGGEHDATARGLLQLANSTGQERLEVAGLLGLSVSRMHAWGWRSDPVVVAWQVPALDVGMEAGRVGERWRVRGRVTGRLASVWVPHQLAVEGEGAVALVEGWTAACGAQGRIRGLEVWQNDRASRTHRLDREWTGWLGVGRTW